MKEEALGMMCCVLLFAIPIGLLIGAAILRGGVYFANKCLPRRDERYDDDYDDWDDYDDRPRRRRRLSAPGIPEPGLGKAMAIVLIRAVIGFVIGIVIGAVMGVGMVAMNGGAGGAGGGMGQPDPALQLLASLIQLPIGFLVNAGVLTGMLPTSFGRACLVVLFEYIISIAICIVIIVPFVAFAILAG